MSVEIRDDGSSVHYPQDPNRFSFDAEVSKIFPDMARRSIPMYEEAHKVHVSLLRETLASGPVTVLDLGASRGHFLKEICRQSGVSERTGFHGLRALAVDISRDMLDHLAEEMPWVETYCIPAEEFGTFLDNPIQADAACLFYVLQFIPDHSDRIAALRNAYRHLKPGGVLFIGQKEQVSSSVESEFTETYYRFRMDNGYTIEEIRAKTAALKGSMRVDSRAALEDMVKYVGFSEIIETTRWLQFATYMVKKPL